MKNQSDTKLKLRKECIVNFSLDMFLDDLNFYTVTAKTCPISL